MQEIILGISAFYHDSAAAIIADGKIIAAVQEERFTRKKHDESFPVNAIQYVLQEAGITAEELTAVAFYDKPLLKFERLLETYHAFAPRGWRSFMKAIPVWLREKIFMKRLLNKELEKLGAYGKPLFFPEHHLSHAASAFYPSPYTEAAILTVDGVGEWATTTIAHGKGKDITLLKELRFPHSPGLLYAAFTYFLGFKVNSGEYKMMGLAPYGDAAHPQTCRFREIITGHLVDIREDGSILLNMEYFDFATGMTMIVATKWEKLFGIPRRLPESEITEVHMNLALAIQQVTEAIVVKLAKTATRLVGSKKLVLAGGVALNCVANSRIAEAGIVESIWVQPAAGDAGGALGAALAVHHIALQQERSVETAPDGMQGAFLGPSYSNKEVDRVIRKYNAAATYYTDFNELTALVSVRLAEGKVVGWFQDRMEFGPRALGNRSILADPRNREMQQQLNLRVKFREGFRPFAPAIPEEDLPAYFDMKIASPYMLFVGSLKDEWKLSPVKKEGTLYERLYQQRSMFPAITHVDHSARVQVVSASQHPKFHQLISCFKQLTGCPMLVNTSFNVRGEPIVNTPEEAFLAFMKTGIDHLVIGNYLFDKTQQPVLPASVFSTFSAD